MSPGRYLDPMDDKRVLDACGNMKAQKQAYGITISTLILSLLVIPIYFSVNSRGPVETIFFRGGLPVVFGAYALLCFYWPYKAIVLRIGRILIGMSFWWHYYLGGGDEIILIAATISLGIGFIMIIYGVLVYFSGLPIVL